MNEPVIIIGAGGHGKVVADIVCRSRDRVVGFLDDNPNCGSSFSGFPVLGTTAEFTRVPEASYIIAIGNARVRERLAAKIQGIKWYTAVHPSAVISETGTTVGEGTVIMANVVINPGTTIGRHCIINSGAVVEHDNVIEDFVHVSVGAKLAGSVHIGRRSWIGIGASVSNNVVICEDCMIGAGGVVVRDIEKPGTYAGVPVKRLEKEEENCLCKV